MVEEAHKKLFDAYVNSNTEYTFAEFQRTNELPLPDITPQDLSGKIVIVTGANAGIGYETAKSLATMKPKKLILACRNTEKAQAAKATIESATNLHDIEVWQLDLASFASTEAFAKKFNDTGLPLDILVSNAGIASPTWVETSDGYEIATQVNHLCNVLLVSLLHPALKKAVKATSREDKFPRVNIVASTNHFWASHPLPDDPHPVQTILTKRDPPLSAMGTYPSSKLLNILFAKAYAEKCPDSIWICSTCPGYTETELAAKDPSTGAAGAKRAAIFKQRTTYEGAKSIIEASISPKVGESGSFFSNMVETLTRSTTRGDIGKQFAENVWNDTIAILKKHVPHTEIYSW